VLWQDYVKLRKMMARVERPDPRASLEVPAFITEPHVVRKILEHLKKTAYRNRAPPPELERER
jgi:hypothetical protein